MPAIPSEEQEKQKISEQINKVFSEIRENGGNINE